MITYTVKYRKSGTLFWRTITRVKGDCFVPSTSIMQFIREDESLTEINLSDHEVAYSKERYLSIVDRMNREAGQPIQTDPR